MVGFEDNYKYEMAIDQASQLTKIPVSVIKSKTRLKEVINARRMVAGYLNLMFNGYGIARLGRLMDRHHTSVMGLINGHKAFMQNEKEYQEQFGLLLRRTNSILINQR